MKTLCVPRTVGLTLLLALIAFPFRVYCQQNGGQSIPQTGWLPQTGSFSDYFTNNKDTGWTQINRYWRLYSGRYVLDGGYRPDAIGRGGFTVTHVNDRSWQNYVMEATFDDVNPGHQPSPDVHQAFFFVRVQSNPPDGTFYRIEVWPKGTIDPRTGSGILPGGLVQIEKYVNGNVVKYIDRAYSNSIPGTNDILIGAIGNTIVVWINGQQILSLFDSSPLRYGGIGLGAIWEAQAWFDNVTVTPLPATGP